jgi:hypothetical protein
MILMKAEQRKEIIDPRLKESEMYNIQKEANILARNIKDHN